MKKANEIEFSLAFFGFRPRAYAIPPYDRNWLDNPFLWINYSQPLPKFIATFGNINTGSKYNKTGCNWMRPNLLERF
jgi:hypothetical protein